MEKQFVVICELLMLTGSKQQDVNLEAKPETLGKVCDIVRKQLVLAPETIVNGDSKFVALGADSLDTVEIVMGLQEEFRISVEEETPQGISTVQDAADLIQKLIEKGASINGYTEVGGQV